MIGVREMDQHLEQWQMNARDLSRRMILAPTPQGAGTEVRGSAASPGLDGSRPWRLHLERDPHTIGRWAAAFGEGGPEALIFEQTGGSPRPQRGAAGGS